jgi:hypothetical protein
VNWFPLPIFPEGALSASVIVTVWVGITVVCLANLRLGWVLSGLVIPGYLVPLLIVKPSVAMIVFAEGIITYWLVWLYSEYMTRYTGLSSFFGRDRFFALVLASVAVRIVADGWLLPEAGEWLLAHYDFAFDYRSNLHSFGLIIVALVANNFWKTGLIRGIGPMAAQVALTWLVVRYGLMNLTNFNMASLAFMYENTASSFLATPKAYIVLLVTAFVASRLNLFYGWDFSGILIPSLLALEWFEPYKIFTTLAETAVILVLASLALRLPVFRNMTMEGARKLLLFFNVSFAYKYVLSWALVLFLPDIKVSDWFGFGYLLATLLALKMHDKGIFARVTAATLQTSLGGIVVATLIGFVLVLLPDLQWKEPASIASVVLPAVEKNPRDIGTVLNMAKTGFYAASLEKGTTAPLQRELDAFAAGVRYLLEYRRSVDPATLESARRALLSAQYDVVEVAGAYLLLQERAPVRHWGTYALRLARGPQLLVGVPAPVDEAGTFEAAVALFSHANGHAFASAGSARQLKDDGSFDVLAWPQTMFQAFHREVAPREVIQLRSRPQGGSILHLSGQVPEGLDLKYIEQSTSSLQVQYSSPPGRNLQRQTLTANFAELWLSPSDVNRMRWSSEPQARSPRENLSQSVEAAVRQMVTPQNLAAAASGKYAAPRPEELLRVDREVLSPLWEIAATQGNLRTAGADASFAYASAAASGASLGLQVRWLADPQADYFLVSDASRAGGWILIRHGSWQNFVVEVPRPLSESGILELSLTSFTDLRARMLIIAGAAPDANKDASADVLAMNNARSLFTLAHQVALRKMRDEPGLAVQVRAFGVRPGQPAPTEDAVLSFDTLVAERSLLPELPAALLKTLQQSGLQVRVGGGGADTTGLDAGGGPQAAYMNQTRNKHFATLWVSPVTRRQTDAEAVALVQRQFIALGLQVRQANVVEVLSQLRMGNAPLPVRLRADAEQYYATEDVVRLSSMQRSHPDLTFERLDDEAGRGGYLLIKDLRGVLIGVMSLSASTRSATQDVRVPSGPVTAADSQRFVSMRARWMVVQ